MTKTILIDNKSIHIEGYKHIVSMDDKRVVLDCGRKCLNIIGDNLKIEIFTSIELNIYGIISMVEWSKI